MNRRKFETQEKKYPKGFTMIELIIVIGLFGIISSVLMNTLLSVYQYRDIIRNKKEVNFEASSILNNGIPGLIRSGFAINYNQTDDGVIEGATEGVQGEVDSISVFTDRAETQYFTIYRKPYTDFGNEGDTAPLYVAFSNGEEFPLHTSEVVVEDFNVTIPQDPRLGGDRDIQPYVNIYLRLRKRYPFGEVVSESTLDNRDLIRSSYQTTIALRNANSASNKTLAIQ